MPDHTIAENLTRLQTARTNIATAITTKGGTVAAGAGFEDFSTAIGTIPAGGGDEPAEKDVNFYDYDGTLVYSYTAQEFLALTELPANPTHTGLTAQGWNWTLTDAKTYVTANGKLEIGQNYVTDDGKTRFYIDVSDVLVNVSITAKVNGTGSVVIDWGDDTTPDTVTLTGSTVSTPHTYTVAGHYCISYTITSGTDISCYNLICTDNSNWNRVVDRQVYKVEYGTNVIIVHENFYSVESVNIPHSCKFGDAAFRCSESLKSLVMPYELLAGEFSQEFTPLSLQRLIFNNGYNGTLSYALQKSLIVQLICPPTLQYIGNYALTDCKKLKTVIMPNVALLYGNAFENCIMLDDVVIASGTTQLRTAVFKGCLTLTNVQIPASVTTIQANTFRDCVALKTITINKAQDSISGAPWGAPNATVVWTG